MLDNQLIKNIITVLTAGLIAQGITGVTIKQAYQPTNQGAVIGPTLYIHKISDHRYGTTERKDVWDTDSLSMTHTERQLYETQFQITALSIQDPANVTSLTASDLANAAAAAMQSDVTISALQLQKIAVYRITDIRNQYFVDDKERYEASPSFDIMLQHEQILVTTTPSADQIELKIQRV